jgi:hypothetical protein
LCISSRKLLDIDYVVELDSAEQDVGVDFAAGFYDAIMAGRTYEDAFEFGVSAARIKGISTRPLLRGKRRAGRIYRLEEVFKSSGVPDVTFVSPRNTTSCSLP